MDDYKIIVEQEHKTVMAHYDVNQGTVNQGTGPCLTKKPLN